MSDINIDDFLKDAAKVLTVLYTRFPKRHTVFVEDICGPQEIDEFGMPNERHISCFSTLLWLGEENYLRFEDTIRQEAIDQAVLTGHCFTLLCQATDRFTNTPESESLPESIRLEQSTNVHNIRNALKSRSSAEIRASMLRLMDQIGSR